MSDVLKPALKFLKKAGFHPQGSSVFQRVMSSFMLSIALLIFVLNIIEIMNFNEGIVEFAKKFEALISLVHFYFKLMMFFYFKKEYILLLETTEKFWKIDNIPEKLKKKQQALQKLGYIGFYCFLYTGCTTIIVLCLKPLMTDDSELPWILYVPNKYFLNKFTLYVSEISLFIYITLFIPGHDFVYVGFCINSIIQFRLIKYILTNINFDVTSPEHDPQSCFDQIKKCVDHHNLLIKFIKTMGQVYSPLFLLQMVVTVWAVCLELFASMESWKYNKTQTIISLLVILVLLIQLGMYCFPAAEVTAEAEEVGNAMYNSNWCEGEVTFRKHVQIIIRKGQETLQFSPGGMGAITRETFAAVIRTSYSIFTVISAAQRQNN